MNTEDLKEGMDRFARYLYARRGFSESTVELASGFMRRACGSIGLITLSHDDIDRYITDLRKGGASYAHVVNACRALELYSEFQGEPIKLGRPRKPQRASMSTLSEGKIAVMIDSARTLRERSILALLAYSGMRNRELTDLRIKDVDIPQQAVTVECGKGSKGRVCCISGECVEILGDYIRERGAGADDLLFVTVRNGHQLQTQDVRKIVRTAAIRAGIKKRVWPHLLRHSLATALLSRGASVYSIQALLGHTYVSTTLEYYLHPSVKTIRSDYHRCVPSFV